MSFPYDPATLHPEITRALTPYEPYASATAIGKVIKKRRLTDGNSLICWAHFLWADALITGFDEDVVQFGEEAEAVLARIAPTDPRAGAAARLGKQIATRMKQARREVAKVLRLDELPEDSLSLAQAQELAYALVDRQRRDPAVAAKLYRLWMRHYTEVPDVSTRPSNVVEGRIDEFYGHHYFYLEKAAKALWWSGKREEARALIDKLLDWPVERDVKLYCAVDSLMALLLLEAVERRDQAEMRRLLGVLRAKYEALGQLPTPARDDVDRLLAFAVEVEDAESLAYIVNVLMRDRPARSLTPATKAHLATATRLLKHKAVPHR